MDHYGVLGLKKNATKGEIKEAFRSLALKFHPDRHAQSPKEVKERATLRFKQISEAYEVLTDDRKRAEYERRSGSFHGGNGFHGGYGYSRSNSSSGFRNSNTKGSPQGVDLEFIFRFLSRKGFLLNVAFASAIIGGAIFIERSGNAIWKMHNSGKSFDDTMESLEKIKREKGLK